MCALHSDTCPPLHLAQVILILVLCYLLGKSTRWLQPIALKIWNPWAKVFINFSQLVSAILKRTTCSINSFEKNVSQVENVKEDGGGNSSSSTAPPAACPFTGNSTSYFKKRTETKVLSPGKTSSVTNASSDPAACPGGTSEPLTNGHTVESKKND